MASSFPLTATTTSMPIGLEPTIPPPAHPPTAASASISTAPPATLSAAAPSPSALPIFRQKRHRHHRFERFQRLGERHRPPRRRLTQHHLRQQRRWRANQ